MVRDPADDNHETTLVVPTLPVSNVLYARMLVDEGAQFVEHAVAFIESERPQLLTVVTRALSAARPTRVSFVRLSEQPEIIAASTQQLSGAQRAACAASHWQRTQGPPAASSGAADAAVTLIFARGALLGSVRVQKEARMFEVSW